MKKLMLATLVVLTGTSVWANTCLEDATNNEILNELSNRLYTSEPSGEFVVSAFCNGWTVSLSATNLETGAESNMDINVGSNNKCETLSRRINDRLSNKTLNRSVIIGSCNGWTVARIIAKSNGEFKRLEDKNLGSSSKCEAEAERINSRW